MQRTLALEIRMTVSALRTRDVIRQTRLALPFPELDDSYVNRQILVDGPRAIGPVKKFLYLEGTTPFVLETATYDFENPSEIIVTRTRINRLFCVYGSYVAASVLPDPDLAANAGLCQLTAIFG